MVSILLWLEVRLLLMCCLTNRSFRYNWPWHTPRLFEFLVWRWWHSFGMVQVLPLYPVWRKEALVWSTSGLCPRSYTLFIIYYSPQQCHSNHPGIGFHFYADDTQLYVHLTHKNVAHVFNRLKSCLGDVKKLSANKLKLNPDKTEFIVFGSKIQHKKINKSFPVSILGNFISPVGAVRNLGVWFDSDFSFSRYVQNICKSCFAQIRDFKHLRGYLTHHVALMAVNALVGSRFFDYCNSLFRSLSALGLRKLQCVQNSLARIVTNTTKYSDITPVRKIVHWLPIEHHSIFKTALLVYKFLHCGYPKYFAPFLKPRQSVYNTRKSQAGGVFPLCHFNI